MRPNRATWWIWTIVGIIIATSYRAAGARATLWVPITYIIGPLVTSLLAIRKGEGGWTQFDRFCALGALLSLGLWAGSRSPDLTLVLNIWIDLLGALPTIQKSLRDPEGENLTAWWLFLAGSVLNTIAIERWSWQIAIYPIYMTIATSAICWVLWQGRRKRRKSI